MSQTMSQQQQLQSQPQALTAQASDTPQQSLPSCPAAVAVAAEAKKPKKQLKKRDNMIKRRKAVRAMVDALAYCSSCDEADETTTKYARSIADGKSPADDGGVLSAAINAHAAYGTGIVDESMKFRADLARPIDVLMNEIQSEIKKAESAELKLMCDQDVWLAKKRVGARSESDLVIGSKIRKKKSAAACDRKKRKAAELFAAAAEEEEEPQRKRKKEDDEPDEKKKKKKKKKKRKSPDDLDAFAREAGASRTGVAISIAFPTMAAYRPACSMPIEIGLLADSMADVAKKARTSIPCKFAPNHSAVIKKRSCAAYADCCGRPDTRIKAKRIA